MLPDTRPQQTVSSPAAHHSTAQQLYAAALPGIAATARRSITVDNTAIASLHLLIAWLLDSPLSVHNAFCLMACV